MATPYPQSKYRPGVPLVGHKSPSDAQKEAGNYPKGHTNLHGMRFSIENEAGTFRRGTDPSGKDWKQKLQHDYGYIRGTKGFDKDHLDVFLGPDYKDASLPVWVIDQDKKGSSDFDEHKAMMGFKDADDAIMAYHSNYEPGWSGFRAATPMSMADFKDWAYAGKSGKRKPASEYVAFKKESIRGEPDTDTGPRGSLGEDPGRGVPEDQQASAQSFAGGGAEGNSTEGPGQRLRSGDTQTAQRPRSLGERLAAKRAGRADQVGDGAAHGGLQEGRAGEVQPPEAGTDPAGLHAGRAATGYREGGAVDGKPGESQRGDDREGRPFIGYRSAGRRPEANNDRRAAKDVPGSVLRGRAAGVLGLPGDVEGILRTVGNAVRGNKVAETLGGVFPGLKLSTDAFGSSEDTTPRLPTSEFYNEWLPHRAEGAVNRAGEFLGNVTAPASPLADAKAAIKGGAMSLPIVKEALKSQAPKIEAALMKAAPAAAPMYAIKPKGGNWFDPYGHIAEKSYDLFGEITPGTPAYIGDMISDAPTFEQVGDVGQKWLAKRVKNYLQNDMGTATDPLLQLEAEGRLWFEPNDVMDHRKVQTTLERNDPGGNLHQALTGRTTRTPLEKMTDALIEKRREKQSREIKGIMESEFPDMQALDFQDNRMPQDSVPDWVLKAYEQNDPLYALHVNREGYEPFSEIVNSLSLEHLGDYLGQALESGRIINDYGGLENAMRRLQDAQARGHGAEDLTRAIRLQNSGLAIDPTKLDRMSLADVGGKAADWGRKMEEWAAEANRLKDWNKGVKEVIKQYPEGGQWVELNPEALADEGEAMGHCVGGYCPSVESGDKRILSYRDQEGPHITVELAKPQENMGTLRARMTPEQLQQLDAIPDMDDWRKALKDFSEANPAPWEIRQIKGKGNRAPVEKYQPFAQDLVRNMGPWGNDIRDLHNTGLERYNGQLYSQNELWDMAQQHPRATGIMAATGQFPQGSLGYMLQNRQSGVRSGPRNILEALDDPDFNVGYAKGGTVTGQETVGQGMIGGTQDNQGSTRRGWGLAVQPQVQSGRGGNNSGFNSNALEQWGASINGFGNNPDVLSKFPTWKVGDEAAEKDIADYIKVAHQGADFQGMGAFLRAGPTWNSGVGGDTGDFGSWDRRTTDGADQLARALGLGPIDWDKQGIAASNPFPTLAAGNFGPTSFGQMNEMLKDYRLIAGLTRDPNDPERAMGEGLYKNINGTWTPIAGRIINAPESHGWARSGPGSDFLTAASMVLPAVGGWAGLAGQTAGTTGATVANVAGNAALGYVRGGTQGALSSLAGGLGGAAGGYFGQQAGGMAGQAIGNQVGSQAGNYLVNRRKTGGSVPPLEACFDKS